MKRFHFSLGAVLTVRKSAENAALKSYAEALLLKQNAFTLVEAVHRELGANWTQIRLAFASHCAAVKIDQLRQYATSLEADLVRGEAALSEAERELSAALQTMLGARQQRQAIDSFRENQRAQYGRELVREDQKFLDDLSRRRVVPREPRKVSEGNLT
jgi:flagellar export protein FliJ